MNPPFSERLLTSREAAELLQVPAYFLTKTAKRCALGLPYYRIGHLVRFKAADLAGWLCAQRCPVGPAAHPPIPPLTGDHDHVGL